MASNSPKIFGMTLNSDNFGLGVECMHRLAEAWLIFGWICLVSTSALANEPSQREIDQAIDELGDDLFRVRERATQFLWEAGLKAEPALKAALKHSDPEVVSRANRVLEKLAWGLTPTTPNDIERLLSQYRSGDWEIKRKAIEKLIDRGEDAYPILMAIISREEQETVRGYVIRQLGSKVSVAANKLLVQGKYDLVERLLRLQAASGEDTFLRNYVAFLVLRGKLESAITAYRAKAANGTEPLAAKTLAYLLRANGDLQGARTAAEQSGDETLLENLLFELGDWGALAKRFEHSPDETSIDRLSYATTFHRLSGDQTTFNACIEHLQQWPNDPKTSSQYWYCAEALMLNHHVNEAITILGNRGNLRGAFELLTQRMQFQKAFELTDPGRTAAVHLRDSGADTSD